MVDTAQLTYEHSNGNTLSFFTDDLKIIPKRLFVEIYARLDGELIVIDPDIPQKVFMCSAWLSATDANTLLGWRAASTTYSGAYPRLTTVYLDGSTTLTNVEVAITDMNIVGGGPSGWLCQIVFTEKTQ